MLIVREYKYRARYGLVEVYKYIHLYYSKYKYKFYPKASRPPPSKASHPPAFYYSIAWTRRIRHIVLLCITKDLG